MMNIKLATLITLATSGIYTPCCYNSRVDLSSSIPIRQAQYRA